MPRLFGTSVVLGYLSTILRGFVAIIGADGTSARTSRDRDNRMETDNFTLRAQREALHSFLKLQERKKQMEAPLTPDRKMAEDAVRQQADASRHKVDEDRRSLEKLHAESTKAADEMKEAVNKRWHEVKSALRVENLSHLLSYPASFKVASDEIGDPAEAMRRCKTTAIEAKEAVQRALIELREHNERRLYIIFGPVCVVVLILLLVSIFILRRL